MKTWLLTHDSHELKKGDVFQDETLPLWLVGKVDEIENKSFEVATPEDNTDGKNEKKSKGGKGKEK